MTLFLDLSGRVPWAGRLDHWYLYATVCRTLVCLLCKSADVQSPDVARSQGIVTARARNPKPRGPQATCHSSRYLVQHLSHARNQPFRPGRIPAGEWCCVRRERVRCQARRDPPLRQSAELTLSRYWFYYSALRIMRSLDRAFSWSMCCVGLCAGGVERECLASRYAGGNMFPARQSMSGYVREETGLGMAQIAREAREARGGFPKLPRAVPSCPKLSQASCRGRPVRSALAGRARSVSRKCDLGEPRRHSYPSLAAQRGHSRWNGPIGEKNKGVTGRSQKAVR